MEAPAKEPPLRNKEAKQIKELKAKLAKLEVKTEDASGEKTPYNKEASEEKVGKCPICSEFHYF